MHTRLLKLHAQSRLLQHAATSFDTRALLVRSPRVGCDLEDLEDLHSLHSVRLASTSL